MDLARVQNDTYILATVSWLQFPKNSIITYQSMFLFVSGLGFGTCIS